MLNQDDYTRELLGLKNIIVKDVENDYGKMAAYTELECKFQQCPKCGQMANQIHDVRLRECRRTNFMFSDK